MSSWKMVLAGALAGALALGAWMLWQPAPPPSGVLEVSGRIEGDQAAIGARIGGKIVELAVREGERATPGQLIAQLSSEQTRAQLEQAEHALHTAREQLGEARAGVVSAQRQAESAEAAVRLAERESAARADEAEAGLGAARAQLTQAEADQDKASRDHGRSRELFARELIAAQQLDEARVADAITYDVTHIPMAVQDLDGLPASRELIARFGPTEYFDIRDHPRSAAALDALLESGRATVGLVIPPDFSRQLEQRRSAPVQLLLDGSNSNSALIALGYASRIVRQYSGEIEMRRLAGPGASVAPPVRNERRA